MFGYIRTGGLKKYVFQRNIFLNFYRLIFCYNLKLTFLFMCSTTATTLGKQMYTVIWIEKNKIKNIGNVYL